MTVRSRRLAPVLWTVLWTTLWTTLWMVIATGCTNPTDQANDAAGAHPDSVSTDNGATTGDAAATGDTAARDTNADIDQPPACQPGTQWTKGTSVFVEATQAWGLTGVVGARLSITDIDGDGRPDLVVRNSDGPEAFAAGERRRWLLRNTGSGFVDITEKSGLFTTRTGGKNGALLGSVLATGDVDNDGDDDIFLARALEKPGGDKDDGETSELLLNNGDGTYSVGPKSQARMAGKATMPAGVTFVDVDRDGNLDLWITQNMPAGASSPLQDRLFRGDGKGGFTDITASSGLISKPWQAIADLNGGLARSRAWSSAACDLNNDGIPELLASSYGRAPNHLWRASSQGASGAVSYANVSVASGYAYDDLQDWTTNINAQCYCLDNPKAQDCAKAAAKANKPLCAQLKAGFGGTYRWNHAYDRYPFRLGGSSGATVCADVNNDGFIDLFTTEIVHWDVGETSDPSELLINQKSVDVLFSRPGNATTGLTRTHTVTGWNDGDMTAAVFDFDNDGWNDIYIGNSDYPGNRGLLYHQGAPLKFTELSTDEFFEHNRSHGVVTADVDGDGDLDMIVGHSTARCDKNAPHNCYATRQVRLFLNQLGTKSNWIQLALVGGKGSNRSAIGARVQVEAGGITQTQEVDGGHGHYNTQKDKLLHFGLAASCTAKVTINWPDAAWTEQSFTVAANRRYRVVQGEAATVITLKP